MDYIHHKTFLSNKHSVKSAFIIIYSLFVTTKPFLNFTRSFFVFQSK